MCDLFQANPWKPLLCTNCHQNRSGHQIIETEIKTCEHLPSSTSSMHLYEEIMAQYLTLTSPKIETTQTVEEMPIQNDDDNDDEDSFSDEEQDLIKPSTIEFVQNQSMINTQGIVLIGPDLPIKVTTMKKEKKINLLKKSKSNADECLKKPNSIDNNTSKLWWFKAKKTNTIQTSQTETKDESNRSNVSSPTLNNQSQQQQKVRVLPDINKLTLNEALNMTRRQQSSINREAKLIFNNNKPLRLPVIPMGQSHYGSSIASTTSSSTQSSNDYDSVLVNNSTKEESMYLAAVSPIDTNLSLPVTLERTIKLTFEHIKLDLRIIIDEYKRNLPVARFQTLKSFVNQQPITKALSNEAIYFVLLQILDEFYANSSNMTTFDHFLITNHSTIPIVVTTATLNTNNDETIEKFIKNLAKKLFDSSSLPTFNDLATFEHVSYRYLSSHIFQFSNADIENSPALQRIKLLDLFWNRIPSLRQIQINEDNERWIFAIYYLMRYVSQSDNLIFKE